MQFYMLFVQSQENAHKNNISQILRHFWLVPTKA
jgi:hypothetical protein